MNIDSILNTIIVFLTLYLFYELYINKTESFANYKIPSDSKIQKEIKEFSPSENEVLSLDADDLDKEMEQILSDNKDFKDRIDNITSNKKKINEVDLPFKKGKGTLKKHKGCKYNNYLSEDYIRNNLLGNNKKCNDECLKKKKESSTLLDSQTNFKDLINTDSNQMAIINHINNAINISKNRFNNKKIKDVYDNCVLNSVNPSIKNGDNTLKCNNSNNENYFLL
jgi:hypothetical protein